WSCTSHTPSIVENCGGAGVSEAPGSGVAAPLPLPRPLGPAEGLAAGADDGAGMAETAGAGVPIRIPGVETLPLGGGGGGGVVGADGPGCATWATAVPPSARAVSPTSAI
ncbi:MAG: hypothetical protein JWO66_680, partial [Candidatus Eremiobacteraeota bacterium]|nr:hypothetical protein [Candidatus Eremiobacteraeota bacterium]